MSNYIHYTLCSIIVFISFDYLCLVKGENLKLRYSDICYQALLAFSVINNLILMVSTSYSCFYYSNCETDYKLHVTAWYIFLFVSHMLFIGHHSRNRPSHRNHESK